MFIRIKCWFTDSEKFISELVLKNHLAVMIKKIIDPLVTVMDPFKGGMAEYVLTGDEATIEKLKNLIETSDYDIDILD